MPFDHSQPPDDEHEHHRRVRGMLRRGWLAVGLTALALAAAAAWRWLGP